MDGKYLTAEHLEGFRTRYKYSSVDTSPLSNYVMHPFWNQVVKIVPRSIAPNLITFVGFLFTLLNALLISYYDYNFCASSDSLPDCPPVPRWVWLACAVSHFLAHTLDGIDGKQARRTGSSGPLGELFDHGLDSWTSLLVPFCVYSLFGRSDFSYGPFRVLLVFWTVFLTFYLAHWEKYNTGILYLPWSYDSSQLALFVMYLITFFNSHKYWKFTIPYIDISGGELFELISHLTSFGISIPVTMYNVHKGYAAGTLKQTSFSEARRPLVPLVTLFIITTGWAAYSPTDIISEDPRMFFLMVGTLFANIASRLIVSQMSYTRCEAMNWMLVPLGLCVLLVFNVNFFRNHELSLLYAMTAFFTLAHIHYGVCVVKQLAEAFSINVFTLKKPSVKASQSRQGKKT